ncbi:MAG: TolC family protein [Pseudomonadota bacterium]
MNFRHLMLCLILSSAQAQPAPPPEQIDLPAVLNLVRAGSPRIALDRQDIELARAERRIASALPNPTLSYARTRPGSGAALFDGSRQQDLGVELPLLIGGQRGARTEAAERGIEAAQARAQLSANVLGAEAGTTHVALLAAQQRRQLVSEGLQELQRLRDIVAGRQASGMASAYDLLRVDVELVAWRNRLADAQAEISDRQGQLAGLLGYTDWRPQAVGELRPLQLLADILDVQSAPLTLASRREEAAAVAATEVARRERYPAVALQAGRTWTREPYGATGTLGLAVEIPLLDTRGGALDRARAQATTASLRRQLAEATVAADLQRYQAQVSQRRLALEAFEQDVGQRLPQLRQMAEDAYRLGRSPVIELLDATRSRYELQLSRIDLTAALMEAQLRLQATRGALVSISP